MPDQSQIWMAINGDNKIEGMLLIFKKRIIVVRGKELAVQLLLDTIPLRPDEIGLPHDQGNILYKKYQNIEIDFDLHRMILTSDNIRKNEKHEWEELNIENAQEILELMHNADPVFWASRTIADITFNNTNIWIGIKNENKIVSCAQIWLDEVAGVIDIVATDPMFQNQGYATTLVSIAARKILQFTNLAFIHVRVENFGAVHVYEKIGFETEVTFKTAYLKKD